MKNKFCLLLVVCCIACVFSACSNLLTAQQSRKESADKASSDPVALPNPIQTLIDGFNGHDPDRMGKGLSDKCEVRYVDQKGNSVIGSKDRATLVKQMHSYFKNIKEVRSEMSDVSIIGRFVTAKESVSWKAKNGTASQYSLVVFELSKNHDEILRVWYYPAQK